MIFFTPSVYEHAARLIDRTPWDVSRDASLLFEAHAAAYETYRHSPIIIGIDIYNLEAEAYGARVAKPQGEALPAIVAHSFATCDEVLSLPLLDPSAGRIPMVIETAARLKRRFPDADVRVPVSGPFSIAANLIGIESLLVDTAMQPDVVRAALHHLAEGQLAFIHDAIGRSVDVTIFESAAAPPLLSPEQFRAIELPALATLVVKTTAMRDAPPPLIIGGDTEQIVDAILSTGTRYVINPSETNQREFMKRMQIHPDATVRVNMNPEIISRGASENLDAEVDRVVALCRMHPRACVGTGVLPYETSPAVVHRIAERIRTQVE